MEKGVMDLVVFGCKVYDGLSVSAYRDEIRMRHNTQRQCRRLED